MTLPKRYQVDPTGGGGRARPVRPGGAHPTPTPTPRPRTAAPTPGVQAETVASAGRELRRRTEGPYAANTAEAQELRSTRDRFHHLTDDAQRLTREARTLVGGRDPDQIPPRELATIQSKLTQAAQMLAQARGLMDSVRASYPGQTSLWVRTAPNQETEMWNFSNAETNLASNERSLYNTALAVDASDGFSYSQGLLAAARAPTGAARTVAPAGPRRP